MVYQRSTTHIRIDKGLYHLLQLIARERKQSIKELTESVLTDNLSQEIMRVAKKSENHQESGRISYNKV